MFDQVKTVFMFNTQIAHMLLEDVSEEEMTAQPLEGMNHPAWLVGHLSIASDGMMKLLGGHAKWGEAESALYGAKSTPLADASRYPSKERLMADYDAMRGRVVPALEAKLADDPSAFDKSNPTDVLRPSLPTVGDMLVFMMTTHEAMHLGQLASWRRAMGRPPKV